MTQQSPYVLTASSIFQERLLLRDDERFVALCSREEVITLPNPRGHVLGCFEFV